jgi:hypothetical protein
MLISPAAFSSPLRPVGLEKLEVAKKWFRQSQDSVDIEPDIALDAILDCKPSKRAIAHQSAPTRLLSIGGGTEQSPSSVHLITECASLQYMALSHRWGDSQHLTTTCSNYLQHLKSIEFRDIPKTFQDAIKVARALDIRYIWIDALCKSLLYDYANVTPLIVIPSIRYHTRRPH